MPHHKSAFKRMRQDKVIKIRNSAARSRMRTAIRKVHQAGSKQEAEKALLDTIAIIDRTARKGAIHKNTANRYKSRLTRFVNSLPSEQEAGGT
ncbi:MAG: 30S ribosomal protein S20 [Candidatus Latescibacterota bacterium]|nr:MAG: 30S ribosomal protein S20 [Candidatus Latescibacterota bacterium]RKY72360.1 MAG: 30S ribosomal protein S20 [Candidatus Latescibacterota bacterium]